ncbi:uncharacterized protein LOC124897958 [Capsicum annuum]|uniref:uncharacterized protein LOC124897958 n=1 Tax=Capsicum annuum TaxID=4072 RepID=UPI001FB12519|nr:uncharacterized protein LOC124897958 [Capsicum annuum]
MVSEKVISPVTDDDSKEKEEKATSDEIHVENKTPPLPFPQRKKVSRRGQLQEILGSSKAGSSKSSSVVILQSAPKYAKYLKDIVANKNWLTEYATVALTEKCTLKIQNKLLTKLKHPVDPVIPFILARTFLAIGKTLIDVEAWKMTMKLHDKREYFNVYEALKLPAICEELSTISFIDLESDHRLLLSENLLERVWPIGPSPKALINESSKLDLKVLIPHLRYVYLGHNDTLPVILSVGLYDIHVKEPMTVLKRKKKVIGWQISDITGINLAFCMHNINMEDGFKPRVQQQRKLNPVMEDVVWKEVIKWLDNGIVYPISDSKWVRPIHCIPKNSGINVVTNEANEIIPTCIVTGWRICIDYCKINEATKKNHYPVPFID